MKKIILSALVLMLTMSLSAQVDRSKAPAGGPAPEIHLDDAKSFTLKNGLKVLVVEDHKLPVISMSMSFIHEPTMDKELNAVYDVYGEVWKAGTKNMTKDEINEQLDFIGASISTGSRSIGMGCLSKYTEDVFDIMTDILFNPTFPQEEIDKTVVELKSGLESSKTDPGSIMSNIKSATVYQGKHPYGMITTEETIKDIKLESCWKHYNTYIKPNNAILVVVGDITFKEAKKLISKKLKSWKAGDVPAPTYDFPAIPKGVNVVFSNKDAAPQSSVSLYYPLNFKVTDEDIFAASIANFIYGGGGFQAKLMKNLREVKGYTYGAYSSLSADRLVGAFSAGGEMIAKATDSSFVEMVKEMNSMLEGDFTEEDLQMAKATFSGSFSRALESSSTIANFAYNIERQNLPKDYYRTYLQKIDALTREDILVAAKKYFHPEDCYFFVVGDRALIPALEKLDSDGVVVELDYKGDVVVKEEVAADVTAESVINKFLDFSGGKELIRSVKDFSFNTSVSVQGMTIVTENKFIYGEEVDFSVVTKMGGNPMMVIKYVDGIAEISSPQGKQALPKEQSAMLKSQGYFITEAYLAELGVTPVLEGIEDLDGKKVYKVKFDIPGSPMYKYYDVESGAALKSVVTAQGQTQEGFFVKYEKLENGINYPTSQQTVMMGQKLDAVVSDVKINQGLTKESL